MEGAHSWPISLAVLGCWGMWGAGASTGQWGCELPGSMGCWEPGGRLLAVEVPHLSLPTPACSSCQPGVTYERSTMKELVFCLKAIN